MNQKNILSDPIKINSVKIKNRLVKSATQENMANDSGIIKQSYYDFYEKLGNGGVGLIITGNMYVNINGRNSYGMAGADLNEQIPYLKKVTNVVHKNNAIIFAQLNHAGILSNPEKEIEKNIQSPYKFLWAKKMSLDEIKDNIEYFTNAASRMKKAGFDGIQLHGAHNYLIAQFLSKMNRRDDKYGGCLKNRQRFCFEIFENIRNEVGEDFPIIIKLDSYSKFFSKKLINFSESLNTAKKLEELGIDGIEVSCGADTVKGKLDLSLLISQMLIAQDKKNYAKISKIFFRPVNFYYNHKFKFIPHHNIEHIKIFKQKLKIPIIANSCFRKSSYMKEVIKNKKADMISLARPLIFNPNFPKEIFVEKSKKSNCNNCNLCLFLLPSKKPLQCHLS